MAFDLLLPETTLIDSTLRLRRTEGNGAFVGPHIDIHEDLPVDGLNFWISFGPLGREETIQFLPPEWILAGAPSGHFKAGVYRDTDGRMCRSILWRKVPFRLKSSLANFSPSCPVARHIAVHFAFEASASRPINA
jgi:hypothetical protein